MQKIKEIQVKETLRDLRLLQQKNPSKFKSLQMLILIKEQGNMSKYKLAALLGSGQSNVGKWRTIYLSEGIEGLLVENRGGHKKASIHGKAEKRLFERLHDPKAGFRSFKEIQQWLLDDFAIEMQYQAVNKFVKRRYGARLKVSRKSHVLKSPADEAVFKKPI